MRCTADSRPPDLSVGGSRVGAWRSIRLRSGLDVAAVDAVEGRLEVRTVARCFEHAQLLRDVLELHRLHSAADSALATVPQLALLLQISGKVAHTLLAEARLLTSLPGALEALECGLLTVPQSAVFLRAVGGLGPAGAAGGVAAPAGPAARRGERRLGAATGPVDLAAVRLGDQHRPGRRCAAPPPRRSRRGGQLPTTAGRAG